MPLQKIGHIFILICFAKLILLPKTAARITSTGSPPQPIKTWGLYTAQESRWRRSGWAQEFDFTPCVLRFRLLKHLRLGKDQSINQSINLIVQTTLAKWFEIHSSQMLKRRKYIHLFKMHTQSLLLQSVAMSVSGLWKLLL